MRNLNFNIVFVLFFFLISGNKLFAIDCQKLFEKGNAFYSKAKYSEAIHAYKTILSAGECSSELYFNLGNAYYKMDSLPQSILYFEKAKVIDPTDEDLNANLKMAHSKTTDKIENIPQLFFVGWYQNFLQNFSTKTWAWFSVIACFIAFLFFTFFVISQSQTVKRICFFSGTFSIILCIGLVCISSASNSANATHRGVIFSSSVTLKSEPNASSTSLFVVHEGATCRIVEKVDLWLRVRLDNGNEGWLSSNELREI